MPGLSSLSITGTRTAAVTLAYGAMLLLASCYGKPHFRAHFGIILDPPDAVAARPSPTSGGGDGGGGSAPQDTGPTFSGGSGGGGAGGAAPPTGAGLVVVTQDRLSVQAIAGTPAAGLSLGADATSAGLEQIAGITTAPDGTVYACDSAANQIRAIPPTGPTYVAAGAADGSSGYIGDNLPANAVRLNSPVGIIRDNLSGALIVCDSGNNRIRYFTDGGRIYTLAGGGLDPSDHVSRATFAALQTPFGLAADSQGKIYFTERGSGRVRELDAAGAITTLGAFASGTVGPIAVSSDGSHLWVGVGDAVQLLTPPATATTLVYQAPGEVITGIAYDQVASLYVKETSASPLGASDTALIGLLLADNGTQLAGTAPERLAGAAGIASGAQADVVPVQPVLDARTQAIAGGGFCSLYIDLYAASNPNQQSGVLYTGNSATGTPAWAQLLRLVRS